MNSLSGQARTRPQGAAAPSTLSGVLDAGPEHVDHLEQDADGAVAGSVVTLAERRLAVEHWLLSAADDRARARHEWRTDGYALLRCGGILGAVQISAAIVHAAAGCDEPLAVNSYLARALLGPAFVDRETLRYYALVGSSTGRRTEWNRSGTGAGFMGTGHYLGVPAVHVTSPTARLAWCVGMDSPGDLAPADAVCQLVHTGRYRLAGGERSLGG